MLKNKVFTQSKDRERGNNQINVWSNRGSKHYAPNIASHFKNNTIEIGIYSKGMYTLNENLLYNLHIGRGFSGIGGKIIGLKHHSFTTGFFLHELVHSIGKYDLGAFAAMAAANYLSLDQILENWKLGDVIKCKNPDILNSIVVNGQIDEEKFLDYGREIIGVQ